MRLTIDNLSKAYGELTVFSGLSLNFEGPGIYCLMAPSGTGKTTLFRLILGLEQPDGGGIYFSESEAEAPIGKKNITDVNNSHTADGRIPGRAVSPRLSSVFQEDRLLGHLAPVENLRLVLGKSRSRDSLIKALLTLLPSESLKRPVSTLSGGMKRRLAFLRAMLAPSDIILLDEPFTGLDEKTKTMVLDYLLAHQEGRLFLIATHNYGDVKKLGAALTVLP